MGVVLTTGLVIMAIMTGFELYVVRSLRPEKFRPDMYSKYTSWAMKYVYKVGPWIEKSALHSLVFSLALSIGIGLIYPIAGIAAFVGGVGSTVAIQPYYMAVRVARRTKGSYRNKVIPAVQKTKNTVVNSATWPGRMVADRIKTQ